MSNTQCSVAGCGNPAQEMLCRGCLTELVTGLRELAYSLTDDRRRDRDCKQVPQVEVYVDEDGKQHARVLRDADGRKLMRPVARDRQRGQGLIADLNDVVIRRTRLTVQAGGKVRQPPEPLDKVAAKVIAGELPPPVTYHAAASLLLHRVRNQVGTWARDFAEINPHLRPDYDTVAAAAEWMARFPALLAMHPAAAEMHTDIGSLVTRIRAMVDRAPDRQYVGQCSRVHDDIECPEDLYAVPGRATVRCRTCGAEHDIATRRETLAAHMTDQLATAAEITRIVPLLTGREISGSTVRQWAHVGKLTGRPPHPADAARKPRYRIGDAVTLVLDMPTRRRSAS